MSWRASGERAEWPCPRPGRLGVWADRRRSSAWPRRRRSHPPGRAAGASWGRYEQAPAASSPEGAQAGGILCGRAKCHPSMVRVLRSCWRSSSLVPPQTPWTWRVASAYCRHSRRTGQRAQTAFACAICCSAGPEGAMGKNRSGSQLRQAARDSQPAELASVAAPAGTEITGPVSPIDCWYASREAPARRGLIVFTAARCCECGAAARPFGTADGRVLAAGSALGCRHEGWRR